jgi:hypothetical protein
MVGLVIFLAIVVLACFGFVLLFGAPYLPTLNKQVNVALELADLKTGQTLLELGCGDGRLMVAAAKKGITVVGYELNPILVIITKIRIWRYRKNAKVVWGNFWKVEWPAAEAIFVFLLPKYMEKLDKKIVQSTSAPVKLISFAFTVPDKKPIKYKQGVYLYDYR